MRLKDTVIIGMLGALLVAVQVGLAFLPNIELVSLLIIVFTRILGKKTLYIISIFVLLEGFLYGFGIWWINYLYIWFILYLLASFLGKKEDTVLKAALLSGFYGISFGALCAIPYVFFVRYYGAAQSSFQNALAYWISGIPFDITHGIGNFALALFLYRPLTNVLKRLVTSYYAA
jgi:energy-coupling factor transport system substrate-specific component